MAERGASATAIVPLYLADMRPLPTCTTRGAPIQAISMLLGHARLSTTTVYSRVSLGRMMAVYSKAHPHAA